MVPFWQSVSTAQVCTQPVEVQVLPAAQLDEPVHEGGVGASTDEQP